MMGKYEWWIRNRVGEGVYENEGGKEEWRWGGYRRIVNVVRVVRRKGR
jgi:hypothetical protein